MLKSILALTWLSLAALGVFAVPAMANPAPVIQSGAQTAAPLGFQLFCLRTPQYCARDSRAQVAMSADLMAMLERVNGQVNRSIRPKRRTTEVWEVGANAGDCKDYVMNKRHRLIELGLPPGALRVAITRTRNGEGHTVLVVRTNAGDLVLDNLTGAIKPWASAGYSWIAMSSSDPRTWHAVR